MPYIRSYHNDLPPEHECSAADIEDLIRELHDLDTDPNLRRYEDPTMAEMVAILNRAATYTGPWYHTRLVFNMEAEPDEAYMAIRQQLFDMGAKRGLFISSSYPSITIDFDSTSTKSISWAEFAEIHDRAL